MPSFFCQWRRGKAQMEENFISVANSRTAAQTCCGGMHAELLAY